MVLEGRLVDVLPGEELVEVDGRDVVELDGRDVLEEPVVTVLDDLVVTVVLGFVVGDVLEGLVVGVVLGADDPPPEPELSSSPSSSSSMVDEGLVVGVEVPEPPELEGREVLVASTVTPSTLASSPVVLGWVDGTVTVTTVLDGSSEVLGDVVVPSAELVVGSGSSSAIHRPGDVRLGSLASSWPAVHIAPVTTAVDTSQGKARRAALVRGADGAASVARAWCELATTGRSSVLRRSFMGPVHQLGDRITTGPWY